MTPETVTKMMMMMMMMRMITASLSCLDEV